MQKYSKINATDYVKDTLLALNDTHETLVSQNSGTAFPTTNLIVGMKCFRTDQNKTYTLKSISPLSWVLTEDLNKDIYNAETLGGKKPTDFAHPTGDGNLHIPATGTANNGKVLTAGSAAGSFSWQNLPAAYSHPTGDGSLHVPATGTTNKGKVLKAGATAGSLSWETVVASEISGLPTSLPASGGNAATVGGKTVEQIVGLVAGANLWVSGEYTPVINTPTIVTHGIAGLDPLKAQGEVLLKCVTADGGYSVGDFARSWFSVELTGSAHNCFPPTPFLSATQIQFNTGVYSTGIVVMHKSSGGAIQPVTPSRWRYIFKIWY